MSLQIPANWSASTDHDSVILEKNSTVRVGLVELDGLQKNVTWDTEGENWIAMKNYSKVETSLTDTGSGQKIDFGQGDYPRSFESACSATNIGVPKDRNGARRIMKWPLHEWYIIWRSVSYLINSLEFMSSIRPVAKI